MLQNIHLKGVGPAPELSLDFAPRLNLLTGDNGLGKSFVLDIAWWALTGTWAGRPAWPREDAREPMIGYGLDGANASGSYLFDEDTWWRPEGPPSANRLVLYARVDGSFSVWDSARNTYRWEKPFLLKTFLWAYHFSPMTLWDGLSEDGRVLCEGLIRDWVSWQRQETETFQQLRAVLDLLSPEGEPLRPGEPTRVSLGDVRDQPTLAMPYGKVPLILSSAGMKRVISLAYLFVWAWQEHLQASQSGHLRLPLRLHPERDRGALRRSSRTEVQTPRVGLRVVELPAGLLSDELPEEGFRGCSRSL
jgi:hypothetical protein